MKAPLLINALTGGTRQSAYINARLAQVAKQTGLGLAVGSQRIALDDPSVAYSFKIVRSIYPKGTIFANIGAGSNVHEACRAVEMLAAQGLQVHLNVAQEMAMAEGDRSFTGVNILQTLPKDTSSNCCQRGRVRLNWGHS